MELDFAIQNFIWKLENPSAKIVCQWILIGFLSFPSLHLKSIEKHPYNNQLCYMYSVTYEHISVFSHGYHTKRLLKRSITNWPPIACKMLLHHPSLGILHSYKSEVISSTDGPLPQSIHWMFKNPSSSSWASRIACRVLVSSSEACCIRL